MQSARRLGAWQHSLLGAEIDAGDDSWHRPPRVSGDLTKRHQLSKSYQIGAAMSALGQKQTYAVRKAMSALPLEADMCGTTRMSAMGQ